MTDSSAGILVQSYAKLVSSPRARVIAAAVASAITWFCWAYWANREDPQQALLSGLFQGGVNFLTTAFGSALLEALYNRIGYSVQGRAMCVVVVSSGSLLMMLCAHWLASTPNILLTVLPVYTVVILYCSSYIFGLHKIKNKYETEEVAVQ